jgi:hypothetical protein
METLRYKFECVVVGADYQLKIVALELVPQGLHKDTGVLFIILPLGVHVFHIEGNVFTQDIFHSPGDVVGPFESGVVGVEEQDLLTVQVDLRNLPRPVPVFIELILPTGGQHREEEENCYEESAWGPHHFTLQYTLYRKKAAAGIRSG